MDIVGYARLSKAAEESTSIARQREVIEKVVAQRGDTLVGIFEDDAVSASKARLERPGLKKALASIEEHGSAALMVWRLDRLARSVIDFMHIVESGVEVISATEPIDTTTPMGRAMAQVLQVFAELESRTTGLRAASSYAYLRQNGRWTGGQAPYGYRAVDHPDGAGKALDIEPAEADVIRRVADEVLEGSTVHRAVTALNDEGIKPRRAAHWTPRVMQRILLSPSTLGRVPFKGNVIRDERGLPLQVWPPILSPEEQAFIRPRVIGDPKAPRRRATRLLSGGLLRCAGCGRRLTVRSARTAALAYGCTSSTKGLRCPSPAYVTATYAEEEVEKRFLRTFGFLRVTEVIESVPDDPGLIVVEEAIRDTAKTITEPGADVAALAARLTDLHAERERLSAAPRKRERVTVETGRTFAEEWEGSSVERRRALLLNAGTDVVVEPSRRGRWAPERLKVRFGSVEV